MGVIEEGSFLLFFVFYRRATYVKNEITTKMSYTPMHTHTRTHMHIKNTWVLVVFMPQFLKRLLQISILDGREIFFWKINKSLFYSFFLCLSKKSNHFPFIIPFLQSVFLFPF